jgi:hypothetical protein
VQELARILTGAGVNLQRRCRLNRSCSRSTSNAARSSSIRRGTTPARRRSSATPSSRAASTRFRRPSRCCAVSPQPRASSVERSPPTFFPTSRRQRLSIAWSARFSGPTARSRRC